MPEGNCVPLCQRSQTSSEMRHICAYWRSSSAFSKAAGPGERLRTDRKSTRLNSSHGYISYAVFCLKKKTHTMRDLSILLIEFCLPRANGPILCAPAVA